MSVNPRQKEPSLLHIDAILKQLRGAAALTEVCRFLRLEFRDYHWVGIYRREGDALVLDGWDGDQPTEHTRIPIAKGLCGQAVREERSVIVADVRASPEYLQCFLDTRSEIVVPVRSGSRVIGEIDVDGRVEGAFDATDDGFLTEVARRIAPALEAAGAAATAPPSS
jgi:L-methionine (R)-S-oxide reductase